MLPDDEFPRTKQILTLSCSNEKAGEAIEVELQLRDAAEVGGVLPEIPEMLGMNLSFFSDLETDGFSGLENLGQFTLRDFEGRLLLLGYRTLGHEPLAMGDSVGLVEPGWLGAEAGDAWNDPLGTIEASHVGCASSDAIPGGADLVSLAVEFATDSGPLVLYDRTSEHDVVIAGEAFHIFVGAAYQRSEPCPECPVYEVRYLVVASQ